MLTRTQTTLLVFLLTLSFYLFTLSPSLAWGDGVKLQSEVISGESFILTEMSQNGFTPDSLPYAKVGVTAWDHPLYIIGGNLLVRLFPSVDSLWLTNLISAVFGAGAVALMYLLSLRYTNSTLASLYAALALAVSHTFWWHSTTPEVYTLLVFLLLAGIHFFQQYEDTQQPSAISLSAFFFGLAASNHVLAFLAFPIVGIAILAKKIGIKKLITPLFVFLLGFSIYLIQFLRMTQNFSLSEIMGPVVGTTFLGNLGTLSPALLLESLIKYLAFLTLQFGPLGIVLGIIGIRQGFKQTSLRKIYGVFVIYTLFGIFYRVSDQFAFFLTSYTFFALFIALGTSHLLATLTPKPRFALRLGLLLTIILTPPLYHSAPRLAEANNLGDSLLGIPQVGTGIRNGLAYYIDPYKRGDTLAYDFGSQTINALPPDAILIAEWYTDTDEYFVLRYFNHVAGIRPDVTIYGFPTEDPFLFESQAVLSIITESFSERPIYLASLSEKFYAASTLLDLYCIVPEHNLYRLYEKATPSSPCLPPTSVTE